MPQKHPPAKMTVCSPLRATGVEAASDVREGATAPPTRASASVATPRLRPLRRLELCMCRSPFDEELSLTGRIVRRRFRRRVQMARRQHFDDLVFDVTTPNDPEPDRQSQYD